MKKKIEEAKECFSNQKKMDGRVEEKGRQSAGHKVKNIIGNEKRV